MFRPELPQERQRIQFLSHLKQKVIKPLSFMQMPENKGIRAASKVLLACVYTNPKGEELHAVSIFMPKFNGVDWILTLSYNNHNSPVGFRSLFSTIPEQPRQAAEAKGFIATIQEGIGSFTDTMHKRAMERYASLSNRQIVHIISDENERQTSEAGNQRARWLSLYKEGGTMGVKDGVITYEPGHSSGTERDFIHVRRGRWPLPRYRHTIKTPTTQEVDMFQSIGIDLQEQQKIDFSKLASSLTMPRR